MKMFGFEMVEEYGFEVGWDEMAVWNLGCQKVGGVSKGGVGLNRRKEES
jgi:hypothetical protein